MAFNASGAAAGASAGAAVGSVVPGIGTVIGGAVGAIAGGFMSGGGGSSGSGSGAGGAVATPQAAQAAAMGSGLDGSAWQVIIGDGNTATLTSTQDKHIDSTGPSATAIPSASAAPAYRPVAGGSGYLDGGAYGVSDSLGLSALGLGGVPPILWVALGVVVLVKLGKKKH
jgi:hypothetical protein